MDPPALQREGACCGGQKGLDTWGGGAARGIFIKISSISVLHEEKSSERSVSEELHKHNMEVSLNALTPQPLI